jgi:hypothetical protein
MGKKGRPRGWLWLARRAAGAGRAPTHGPLQAERPAARGNGPDPKISGGHPTVSGWGTWGNRERTIARGQAIQISAPRPVFEGGDVWARDGHRPGTMARSVTAYQLHPSVGPWT